MRYSVLLGKTEKEAPKDITLTSHRLLHQAGFIRESVAGRYFFMPLAQRVQNKIIQIVKEEMDKAGAQEMLAPVLHPLVLWQETNRDNTAGFELMKIADRRGMEFALGGTAEEMFVDVVRKFQISYRDMPFNVYQFSLKFRDEMRARGGLLRVREFIMKDAYSFHLSEEDFKKEYKKMWETYTKIFKRMGLETVVVDADNGYIGGEYCHEFIVRSDVGESRFLVSEDGKYAAHEDVAKFKLEDVNPDEDVKPFEIVDQPEWVQTMDDNIKHYGKDKRHFLKNVVYKTRTGDLVIATIRGDLEVNQMKLEQALHLVGQLESATDEDLKAIGTKPGWVHSWGHEFLKGKNKVIYVADESLKTVKNFIGGQKEKTTDSINVNYGRDFKHEIEADIAMAQAGFKTEDGQLLSEDKGVEVGNIFQLGYHYSKLMKDSVFIDSDGKSKPYYMGCYGIGIGRTLATIVEMFNDEKGMVWPKAVAPYHVHLIALGKKEEDSWTEAEKIYSDLVEAGVEVLFDDRDESAGKKFADADLIGIPLRLVVSKRSLENGGVEWKMRSETEGQAVAIKDLMKKIEGFITG